MSDVDTTAGTVPTIADEERHASWLELFFDLVVAAGVAQIAHRLHEAPTPADGLACVAMFYALWSIWTAFSTYANVAGDRTRKRALLGAMLGIGALVAAIPGTLPELLPQGDGAVTDRTTVFVIAFVACRSLASSATRRAGKVIAFWPAAQGLVVAPWVASLFVQPEVRYWLWAAGVVLDIAISVVGGRNPASSARMIQELQRQQAKADRNVVHVLLSRFWRSDHPAEFTVAELERSHLEERLSLFVIIVLGEALAQLIAAAAQVTWTRTTEIALVVGFLLLVGVWQLTARYGFAPAPGAADAPMRPWMALPAHFAVTLGIAGIAAGLGSLALAPTAGSADGERWCLCGGLVLYFLAGIVTGLGRPVARAWTWGWALPCLAAAVVLGVVGGPLPGWALTVVAAAVVGWQCLYQPVVDRMARRRAPLER